MFQQTTLLSPIGNSADKPSTLIWVKVQCLKGTSNGYDKQTLIRIAVDSRAALPRFARPWRDWIKLVYIWLSRGRLFGPRWILGPLCLTSLGLEGIGSRSFIFDSLSQQPIWTAVDSRAALPRFAQPWRDWIKVVYIWLTRGSWFWLWWILGLHCLASFGLEGFGSSSFTFDSLAAAY